MQSTLYMLVKSKNSRMCTDHVTHRNAITNCEFMACNKLLQFYTMQHKELKLFSPSVMQATYQSDKFVASRCVPVRTQWKSALMKALTR